MWTTNQSHANTLIEPDSTVASVQHRFTPPAWLAAAVNPSLVREALVRHVAEFATGQLVLVECAVSRWRLHGVKGIWRGVYRLTVEGLLPGQPQVVVVHGTLTPPDCVQPEAIGSAQPFGTDGWRCTLPDLYLELRTEPPVPELAALPQLTDPEQARLLLEESMRAAAPVYRNLQIQACTPQVMRHKPGSRCTILYHLEYPQGSAAPRAWPATVVAKTHHGDKGQNAYQAMQALWHSPLGASHTVAIAEPLAYLPEISVLVQGPIREELTLKDLILRSLRPATDGEPTAIPPQLHSYICKTAAGLAELHRCGVLYGDTITWADELDEIYQRRAKLATPLPPLADWAEDLLARLQRLAATHPADPLAPAHRSFRPAQVLLAQGEIGFIDFDGFCQAEPAMDIALFMTTVKNLGLNKSSSDEDEEEDEGDRFDPATRLARLAQAEAICQLFLREYEKHAPVSRPRVLLWETLNLLSLVLSSWTKLKLARLENCLFMLDHHLNNS